MLVVVLFFVKWWRHEIKNKGEKNITTDYLSHKTSSWLLVIKLSPTKNILDGFCWSIIYHGRLQHRNYFVLAVWYSPANQNWLSDHSGNCELLLGVPEAFSFFHSLKKNVIISQAEQWERLIATTWSWLSSVSENIYLLFFTYFWSFSCNFFFSYCILFS